MMIKKSSKDYNNEAALLHVKGQFDKAKNLYKKAVTLDDKNALAHNNLGFLLAQEGSYEKALIHLSKSVELNSNSDNAQINLGNTYLALSTFDKAEFHLKKGLELNADNPLGWESYAMFFKILKQPLDATKAWYQAIQLKPKSTQYRLELADSLTAIGQFDEAIAQLQYVLDIDTNNVAGLVQLGGIYLKRKDFRIAQVYFQQALNLSPDNIDARYHLCLVYLSIGEQVKALEEVKRILIIDPDNVKVRTDLAVMLLSAKKIKQASKEINRALAQDNSFVKARYYKAVITHLSGENVKAKKLLGKLSKSEQGNYGSMAKAYIEKHLI